MAEDKGKAAGMGARGIAARLGAGVPSGKKKKITLTKQKLAVHEMERAKKRLLNAAKLTKETLFAKYDNDYDGFDEETVEEQRDEFGENEITRQKGDSLPKRLFGAFINPFTIVLFVLAAISLFTDVLIAAPEDRDFTAVIIVIAMVTISGLLRFVQESRSNRSAERLSEMVETTISVQRAETGKAEIPINEIVVGDLVHLAAGDMVPADCRILQAKDLFVSQSSLTGESDPLEKFAEPIPGKHVNPLDLNNLAFMGTNVISGSALAMVINVGDNTIFGSVARQLQKKKVVTNFEKGVNAVSWVLIRFMLVMAPFVLFVNGFTKGNWMEAFLFALSVAVGLTPEMLPMIVSANLAKGAVAMSRKKVIVKDLNSIQNFGAINVLCTDKTGTLTQDRVILEYYLDAEGDEDDRILRHAFLNSYHQTGLKNLMDLAILEHANEKEIVDLWKDYHKVDEIPFDFHRRRMSVVVADKTGKQQLITKGAIEEMLSVCGWVDVKGEIKPLTDTARAEVLKLAQDYNEDGMRVLGLAQKNDLPQVDAFSVDDERDMVLIGYLAFLDPPKESTAAAIKALNEYGVDVKILTGDNDYVTKCVCKQVGLKVDKMLLGADAEAMDDAQLAKAVEETTVFAKLSPSQKARIIAALRANGHTVGYMGDGINDAPAMREADVAVSVDNAVDIAKESANIILLEKDLMVLEQGIVEGRKTYANIIKYIKMTASSNFGNMFSVLAASIFLPFLPMLPIQILVLNLIYDISCITIPWDNVDAGYLKVPRKWDASSITKFMLWIGPTSSVFDIITYVVMMFVICPAVVGGAFGALDPAAKATFIALFHAGWFVESLWSQTLVIHMIRSPLVPFLQSRATWQVTVMTLLGIAVGTALPYSPIAAGLKMYPMPAIYFAWLAAIIIGYMLLATAMKKLFVRRYGELL